MVSLEGFVRRFMARATSLPAAAQSSVLSGNAPFGDAAPHLAFLAKDLSHGEPVPPGLLSALNAHIDARRRKTDTASGPASPRASELEVRRAGLPDWWAAGDNLLLAAPNAVIPELKLHLNRQPPTHAVLVIGAGAAFNHVNLGGAGALIMFGDAVNCRGAALSCLDASTVLIGEGTSATNWALLDACNGGIIVVGDDGMWAHGISLMTDDTHAIRDVATGRRINVRGGRILVDRHVWLGEGARVLEGARIGRESVVGAGTMVKSVEIPAHSVCVGVPARVVRSGVTWSREDAP